MPGHDPRLLHDGTDDRRCRPGAETGVRCSQAGNGSGLLNAEALSEGGVALSLRSDTIKSTAGDLVEGFRLVSRRRRVWQEAPLSGCEGLPMRTVWSPAEMLETRSGAFNQLFL